MLFYEERNASPCIAPVRANKSSQTFCKLVKSRFRPVWPKEHRSALCGLRLALRRSTAFIVITRSRWTFSAEINIPVAAAIFSYAEISAEEKPDGGLPGGITETNEREWMDVDLPNGRSVLTHKAQPIGHKDLRNGCTLPTFSTGIPCSGRRSV